MRTLFVYKATSTVGGGMKISNRNKKAFEIASGNDVATYCLQGDTGVSAFKRLYFRCKKKYTNGVGQTDVDAICRMSADYDCIWLDNSCYGAICKALKSIGYKGRIISFFHNIEHVYLQRPFWQRMLPFLFKNPIIAAERYSAKYADNVVVLTERDKQGVLDLYPKADVTILPSSLKDDFREATAEACGGNETPHLLFVGSYFPANVHGITWFVENVLSKVKAKLFIVGSGMDKLPYNNNEKLEIHGFVEDIAPFYHDADCVVAPIFEGSGMKTKTTEALMWGKYIIGTDEAFCGFDITDAEGVSCSDAESFIKSINGLRERYIQKFNKPSRELYLKKYSLQSSVEILKNMLKK